MQKTTRSNRNRRRRKGFTLIELMIVIAIIGVLAAIAVPNFRAARWKANVRACHANQKSISGAVEMYNLDFNESLTSIPWDDLVTNGYLNSVPTDPGQGGVEQAKQNYALTEGNGAGIACAVHGTVHDRPGPPGQMISSN